MEIIYPVTGTIYDVEQKQKKLKIRSKKVKKACKCYPHWSGYCHCGKKCNFCKSKLIYIPLQDERGLDEKYGHWECKSYSTGQEWLFFFIPFGNSHLRIDYEGDTSTFA